MQVNRLPLAAAQEMMGLTELYLAVGASLDLGKACETFCSRLMNRKNLSFASVWVRGHLLQDEPGEGLVRVYSHPAQPEGVSQLPVGLPLWSHLAREKFLSTTAWSLKTEFGVATGNQSAGGLAWFELGQVGYLELGVLDREVALPRPDMKRLLGVMQKFTFTLKGCLAQRQAQAASEGKALTEKALNVSQFRNQWLVENVADVVYVMNEDLEISFVNRAVEEFLGYTPDQVLRMNFKELLAPDVRDQAEKTAEFLRSRIKLGADGEAKTRTWEVEFQTAEGRLVWGETSFRTVPGSRRQTFEIMGVIRDVSSRKKTEEMLRRATRAAEEANQAKSMFLANMSHEIRTPLNGVIGLTHALDRTDLSGKQAEIVGTILQSAESLLGIINGILDFTKIEAGKMTLEKRDFNLHDLVEDVAALTAGDAQAKGLRFLVDVPPDLEDHYLGDPQKIRQILLNLVSNAVKFTGQGHVRLRVRQAGERGGRPLLSISVMDTGIGIPPEKIEEVFGVFSQVDSSISRSYGGTGLGLAICRQLARLMEAELTLESEPDRGTVFTLLLPLERGAERRGASRDRCLDLAGKRVLVQTDDPLQYELLARQLAHWGMITHREEEGCSSGPGDWPIGEVDLCICLCSPGARGDCGSCGKAPGNGEPLPMVAIKNKPVYSRNGGPVRQLVGPVTRRVLCETLGQVFSGKTAGGRAHHHERQEAAFMSGLRVLVAEDNRINQAVLQNLLSDWGCRVQAVGDGQQAVKACRDGGFDLVLMDVQMPVMDGYQATRAIRARESGGGRTPILACTAHTFDSDVEASLAAGMDGFLGKPIDPRQMLAEVRRVLGANSHEVVRAVTPVAADPAEILDFQRLSRSTGGDIEFAARLARGFLADALKSVELLHEYLEGRDLDSAGKRAHSLKGASLTLGVTNLAATAAAMEKACRNGDHDLAAGQLPGLRQEVEKAAVAFAEKLSIGPVPGFDSTNDPGQEMKDASS